MSEMDEWMDRASRSTHRGLPLLLLFEIGEYTKIDISDELR